MRKIFLIFLACMVIAGCRNEGVVQSDSGSYLSFVGNVKNAFVTVDSGQPFSLKKDEDDNRKVLHQVSTGKHEIIVTRKGKTVLHRKILIGSGMTKEIFIK